MRKLVLIIVLFLFAVPAVSGEMPEKTLSMVKAKIAKKYPDNYSLQRTLINGQKEAYSFLENYRPDGVPADVLYKIKTKYAKKYPNNFSLQKTLITKQVEAYLELQ